MGRIKSRLIGYMVAVLFILVSPGLLIDVLQDESFSDRENLVILVSAFIMTIIYLGGIGYIIGFCVQGAGL